MSNKRKEGNTQTSAAAVAIILIAVVIGVGAIVASLFIVKEKKALDASKKQTVSEEKQNAGQIEIAGPSDENVAEEQNGGIFGQNEDNNNEDEATENDDVEETAEAEQEDESDEAEVENPFENQPEDIIDEAIGEEEAEAEAEETEEDQGENQDGIVVPSVVRIRPLLDNCYLINGRFDKDALAAGGLNEGKVYDDESENCVTFKQLVYAGSNGEGITEDCLAAFAKDNDIISVKTAVEYFGFDFSKAIVKENGDKVLFVVTDMGKAEVTLSDGGQGLCILLTEGIKSDDSSAEAAKLTIEVKSAATKKGINTYIRVGLWY